MLTTEKVLKMNVSHFAEKNVVCVKETADLKTISDLMMSSREKIIWVNDAGNKLIGLITGETLVNAVLDRSKQNVTAKDIMKKIESDKIDSVAKYSDILEDVIAKLRGENGDDSNLSAVPLIDSDGSIKGQVTSRSIADNLDKLIEIQEMT